MRQRFGIAVALLGDPRLIIVDEPTAGLDPEERVRFLNLLAELGQNSIVVLSTHIVDDVSELCSRVAIIDRGRIRLEDDPQAAVTRLNGRIWRRIVSRDELARHQAQFSVLSTKLLAGRTVVRVLADARPESGYDQAGPGRRRRPERGPSLRPSGRRRPAGRDGARPVRRKDDRVLRVHDPHVLRGGLMNHFVDFGIYALVGFLFMLLSGGAFRQASAVFGGGGKVLANAPFALAELMPTIALLGMSIVAAVAGNAIYRDYDARMESLVYSTPISKRAFLGGRFIGTLAVNAIILLGIVVGLVLAAKSPWVKPDKFGPFDVWAYLQPYFTLVWPNLLFTAAIFFALPAVTRQMVPNYVGGVVLLLGYLMGGQLLNDLTDKHTGALLDPFGLRAVQVLTQYWSIARA